MYRKIESVQGKIIRRLLKDVTSTNVIGNKIKSGEFRKNPIEPQWKCPKGYTVEKIALENFEMELLEPDNPKRELIVLQLHGGGYIGPMKNIYRTFAVYFSEASSGSSVLTIDYRVAPENPYPAALTDALAAYDWILANGYSEEQIVISGDSAGGGLTLALCMYLRDNERKLPKGIITMSAWTDLTCEGESYTTKYEVDPLFGNTKDSMIFDSSYIGEHDPRDPYISPVFGSFENFPPMLMQVGTEEMLLDDTLRVARAAKKCNDKVKLTVYEGMFHVFQMSKLIIPESRAAWAEIGEFFKSIN